MALELKETLSVFWLAQLETNTMYLVSFSRGNTGGTANTGSVSGFDTLHEVFRASVVWMLLAILLFLGSILRILPVLAVPRDYDAGIQLVLSWPYPRRY